MPKPRRGRVWKIREDLYPLLDKAKKLFPTLLGHIEVKKILLCAYYAKKGKKVAYVSANRPPWSLFAPDYDYAISFWASRFDNMTPAQQMYVVVHELTHVPALGHKLGAFHRKLVTHTVEDFDFLLKAYGVTWENVDDVLKGEKHLFRKTGEDVQRFPRSFTLGMG